MLHSSRPKESPVRSQQWAIVFQREREINAIPERHVVSQRKIERTAEQWSNLKKRD
jgi:hypothetical protein